MLAGRDRVAPEGGLDSRDQRARPPFGRRLLLARALFRDPPSGLARHAHPGPPGRQPCTNGCVEVHRRVLALERGDNTEPLLALGMRRPDCLRGDREAIWIAVLAALPGEDVFPNRASLLGALRQRPVHEHALL